jgi:purine-nucleoside phosphorylase
MLGFTGTYKGKRVSVMGGGMGVPSIGIYSYELYNMYDVDNIIRIGSAGGLQDDLNLNDVIIAMGACTDSNYVSQFELPGTFAPIASYGLLAKAVDAAANLNVDVHVGNVLTSDVFYDKRKGKNERWRDMGCLAVEMESAGLYMNAAAAHKNALTILTISDHLFKSGELTADEREKSFNNMMLIALELA